MAEEYTLLLLLLRQVRLVAMFSSSPAVPKLVLPVRLLSDLESPGQARAAL
jgi:hypothetical protein